MSDLRIETGPPVTDNSPLASGYWSDLTTTDFAALDPHKTVALLPVAACEQHGPHLPLSTDAIINAGVVDAALQKMPADITVLALPAQTIGDSIEHGNFAGTLSLEFDLLVNTWLSIGAAVRRAGLRKLIIFNTHGGQRAHVDQAAIRLRARCQLLVARVNAGALGMPADAFAPDEQRFGMHGGAIETSLIMHLAPHLVRPGHCADFVSAAQQMARDYQMLGAEKPVGIGWMAEDLHPQGVTGNAATASAAKGATLLAHMAQQLVVVCRELAAAPAVAAPAADQG